MLESEDKSPVSPASDETLALAFQKGDENAFDELVRRYEGKVYAIAFRITLNRDDALDVAQEVFVKVYRNISRWQPSGSFGSWLVRLAVNQSIDALRKKKRHAILNLLRHLEISQGRVHQKDAARQSIATETGERIQAALHVLSPTQRAVFCMRHYDGFQLNEIADALNCTIGSVKVHLFRALRKLQEELKDLK